MEKADSPHTPLKEGGDAIVIFHLKRENYKCKLNVRMKAYNKAKQASWWIIVGNQENNEILALKKIQIRKTAKKEV